MNQQDMIDYIADHWYVKEVLRTFRLKDGRWLYLIETPLITFPKFVVGTIDEPGNAPQVELKCSLFSIADGYFERRSQ